MALQFFDGFDHYNTTAILAAKWGAISGSPIFVAGRDGVGQAIRLYSGRACIRSVTGSPSTVICGFAYRWANGNNTFFQVRTGAIYHIELGWNADASVYAKRGATTLGTSAPGSLGGAIGSFIYIEVKITVDDSAGAVEIRVNGATVLSLTSVDTSNAAGAIDNVMLYGGPDCQFDDFYLCDTTGAANNDFLGDVKVVALYPDGNGDSTQFTPLSGSNYQNVDETIADGDTTYVESSTVGHKDLYTFDDLSVAPDGIFGVQTVACVRKDDAGTREVRAITKSGSTTRNGPTFAPGTTYGIAMDVMETNPDDSAAWELADVNAIQAGVEVVA